MSSDYRKNFKIRLVKAMGSKCQCCGYDRCIRALEFHHLDPKEKDFTLSQASRGQHTWDEIVGELRKCIMVCSNCHKEIHEGITRLPDEFARFDEQYAEVRSFTAKKWVCPVCGKPKRKNSRQYTCSKICQDTLRVKEVGWENLPSLLQQYTGNLSAIGRVLGVSCNAVKKRMKKMNLSYTR